MIRIYYTMGMVMEWMELRMIVFYAKHKNEINIGVVY